MHQMTNIWTSQDHSTDRCTSIEQSNALRPRVSRLSQGRESHPKGGRTNVWAIKSCRVAKTPSEFYLSSQPSFHFTAIGRESLATSVGFLSPSPSSGGQTLIGLDSGSLLSFQPSCPTKSSFPSSAIFLSL